ncbi:MAG: DUF2059 domain-containing protein, partial [Acidobacteria bacterium]|nr:DUF2059 domain-containing protein [Acidobacteriota bacterium]
AKAALIEEYMQVTQAERTMEEALRLAFDSSDDQIRESLGVTETELGEMDAEAKLAYAASLSEQKAAMQKLLDRLLSRVDLNSLAHDVIGPIIDRYFTEDDLRAMIAFSRTPTGRKRVENEAKITVETELAMNKVLTPLVRDIADEIRKEAAEEEHRRNPWRRALADIRSVATAVEAYATDEELYPQAVTMSSLELVISPTYIRDVPEEDPWGHDYVYLVSADQLHYRIISGGADGTVDGTSRVIRALDPGTKSIENRSLDDDIIYQEGMFLTWPPGARPDYEE